MRGCLITIAALVLVMGTAAWFLLPPLAGTVAEGALVGRAGSMPTRAR